MKKSDTHTIAHNIDTLLQRLFPLCRSITGQGVRDTLTILSEVIPLTIHEVPTGTKVFDWNIPQEWNIQDAYIKAPDGKKIVDFKKNNLHVMSYSTPIQKKIHLSELKEHLYSLPAEPDLIPYKTNYYSPQWGFCMTHKALQRLKDGMYEVVIDSSFKKGSLTYGELFIPGKSTEEILISSYVCHPSMANDSLSGVMVTTFLAKQLLKEERLNYSYRFLFVPETIGAITWLSKNHATTKNIKYGLVATTVGDRGPFTYKKSRAGNTRIDIAAEKALKDSKKPYSIIDFFPWGSDERQYNSPGFNLSVGSLMRSMYGTYREYHTSGDDLTFVKGKYIEESIDLYQDIVFILEHDTLFQSENPFGEPQLGKRGLYGKGGKNDPDAEEKERALLWLMAYADGKHSLLDIASISGIHFRLVYEAAQSLFEHTLLKRVHSSDLAT